MVLLGCLDPLTKKTPALSRASIVGPGKQLLDVDPDRDRDLFR